MYGRKEVILEKIAYISFLLFLIVLSNQLQRLQNSCLNKLVAYLYVTVLHYSIC